MTGETARPVDVDAPCGLARSRWARGRASFRGIPFAAPPVGPLRWRPPQPLPRWEGRRPAVEHGPAPIQPQPPRDTIMWHANYADTRALVMSEDCLHLDVHTPDPSPRAGLPVLVWVHGGGNRFGYSAQEIHDPSAFLRAGVVVVTVNYRLGALGWLAHPELAAEADGCSGNYGLHDVVAALRWVQENIGAFGGDPARVTVGGNSAGAVHVCHLMAAPAGAGLFAAAIGQSSAGIDRAEGGLPTQRSAQEAGLRWQRAAGAPGLAALRNRSALEIGAVGHFGPVRDGALLVEETTDVFERGAQARIPLLAGCNADEGSFYALPADTDAVRARLAALPDDHPAHRTYPTTDPGRARVSARAWVGDTRFVWPIWRWARTHTETSGAPAWLYRFEQVPPLPDGIDLAPPRDGNPGFGAFHTAEVPYAWDSLDALAWPWRTTDRALARQMADSWARFVTTGSPTGPGLPDWLRLDPARPRVMRFDERPAVVDDPDAEVRRTHDLLRAESRAAAR